MAKMYYICNEAGIPLRAQPDEGYTLADVRARVSREEATDKELGMYTKGFYRICTTDFKEWV